MVVIAQYDLFYKTGNRPKLGMPGSADQFKQGYLNAGDCCTCVVQSSQRQVMVLLTAGENCIAQDMHRVPRIKQVQPGLQDADMGFNTGQQHLLTSSLIQGFQKSRNPQGAESFLGDRGHTFQGGCQIGEHYHPVGLAGLADIRQLRSVGHPAFAGSAAPEHVQGFQYKSFIFKY